MLAEELGSHQPQARPRDTFLDESAAATIFFGVIILCD